MQKEVYSWITKSKRRRIILICLIQPMTAKQLAHNSQMREDCSSYVLQELLSRRLVYCLNPESRRSRLYWLTDKGKRYRKKIMSNHGLCVQTPEVPVVDWELYGWVCYNHRAAVIIVLTEPLQPAQVRRKIKQQFADIKISANNVGDILRLFIKKGIIKRVTVNKKAHRRYKLTEPGKQFQILLRTSLGLSGQTCAWNHPSVVNPSQNQ